MLLSTVDLLYSSSLISRAFFWANISNSTSSNKQFKILLYPNKLSIGSIESQQSLMNPGDETSALSEENTILFNDLKEIKIMPNSDIFSRMFLILKNQETKKINWFNEDLAQFLAQLTPLLPKRVKITKTTIYQERLKYKLKFALSVSGLVIVIFLLIFYSYKLFI